MRLARRRLAIFGLVACVLIVAALLAYVLSAHGSLVLRRELRRQSIFAVVTTLANYCDVHKRLPPAVVKDEDGTPLASWRMAVLSLSPAASWGTEDTDALHAEDFDLHRSWNDPVNQAVTSRPMGFYCFAGEIMSGSVDTNVFAIAGPGTAFASDAGHRLSDLPHDAIVLIEVTGTGLPWAAPGDLDVSQLTEPITFVANDDCFHVAFADQSVWRIQNDVPFGTLRKFFLVEGARELDRDQELGPYQMK